jgi:insulysin
MHSEMVMVWQHGGHSNAFTAAEYTNFHFDVSADYLDEALAR